jgi:VWFA-related protein
MFRIRATRRAFLTTGASLFATPALLRAQQGLKFAVEVKVVNVLATVRNKRQEIVRDLAREDFILEEDGRAQTIRYFSQESDLPLTLGLVVDTSGSQWQLLDAERAASRRFLEQVLREEIDRAFVMRFDRDVDLLGDLSSSRAALQAALDQLDASDTPGWRAHHPSVPPAYRFWRTALYDAVAVASRDLLMKQPGRKALVVLSDGVDNVSAAKPEEAIRSAQMADALVYSILYADPLAYSGRGINPRNRGVEVLRRLSKETGGSYFEIGRTQRLDKVFGQIERELRSEYSLGYISDRVDTAPQYRKIRLSTRRDGLLVQARDGYFVSG